jgi:hypothetical protein
MSFRRIDMREPYMTKQDIQDYKHLSRAYTYCDKHISFKYLKEIGILLTSHPGNRAYLRSSIETHKKTKLWITLAYDNYFDPKRKDITWDSIMPSREVIDNVNCFVLGPYQTWGGVLFPYVYLLELGLSAMKNFPYIYCANGDCIIEKPEGVFILLDKMKSENADLISSGWWDKERPVFNSTGFIGKTEAIQAMMKHFVRHFIPLKAYEASCVEFGNCEGRLGRAIKDLGLKVVEVENPKNEQLHEKGYGTWCQTLGFRHLHAEEGFAWKYRNEPNPPVPPEIEYLDLKYLSEGDINFLKTYWNKVSNPIA